MVSGCRRLLARPRQSARQTDRQAMLESLPSKWRDFEVDGCVFHPLVDDELEVDRISVEPS